MPEAVIVATARTPIGRANKGSLVDCRPDDLSSLIVDAVLKKVPALDRQTVEDVIWGCAQPAGTLFPPLKEALRWPAPPEPPRVQYVGQLSGSADLKPPVPFLKKVGRTVFGEEATQSLYPLIAVRKVV